jgi:translation initiation factor 2 subunit 3
MNTQTYEFMNAGSAVTETQPFTPPPDLMQEELQPSINVGLIGHVSHGKSTVVKGLTGIVTAKFHKEFEKSMTIKLGYANAKIWFCSFCKDYFSTGSHIMTQDSKCPTCDQEECSLVRHLSFVDCPGHEILMATMLNGATVMDASMIVIGADTKCPQPQTKEHLVALNMMGITEHIIIQNKIDLVTPEAALINHNEIKDFVKEVCPRALDSPIVPTCANQCTNFDRVCSYLSSLPSPPRNLKAPPLMMIVRSFDVNKPGEMNLDNLQGGVAGGSLLRGTLQVGDDIEIRPGKINKLKNGSFTCHPLKSKVLSLASDKNDLQKAYPGGLVGVGTTMDPSVARGDGLVGHVLGRVGTLPPVYTEVEISYVLIPRDEENKAYSLKLQKGETLRLNIGSLSVDAQVTAVKADLAKLSLRLPSCILEKSKIAISRKKDKQSKGWRLIGVGMLQGGNILLA